MQCPVIFAGGVGETRNISYSGALFGTSCRFLEGAILAFKIVLSHSDLINNRLSCEGRVVRVNQQADSYSVAVAFSRLGMS